MLCPLGEDVTFADDNLTFICFTESIKRRGKGNGREVITLQKCHKPESNWVSAVHHCTSHSAQHWPTFSFSFNVQLQSKIWSCDKTKNLLNKFHFFAFKVWDLSVSTQSLCAHVGKFIQRIHSDLIMTMRTGLSDQTQRPRGKRETERQVDSRKGCRKREGLIVKTLIVYLLVLCVLEVI